jgi:hypothetical protein
MQSPDYDEGPNQVYSERAQALGAALRKLKPFGRPATEDNILAEVKPGALPLDFPEVRRATTDPTKLQQAIEKAGIYDEVEALRNDPNPAAYVNSLVDEANAELEYVPNGAPVTAEDHPEAFEAVERARKAQLAWAFAHALQISEGTTPTGGASGREAPAPPQPVKVGTAKRFSDESSRPDPSLRHLAEALYELLGPLR